MSEFIWLTHKKIYLAKHLSVLVPAVREDRMPGGRNSGAVYNLYKVRPHSIRFTELISSSIETRLNQSIYIILNSLLSI